MDAFSQALLGALKGQAAEVFAWCLLPNHYHLLLQTDQVCGLLHSLGELHGRTSYYWNGEECVRGRQVFCRAVEREIRSDRHFWSTLNYVHHNPVHHGYTKKWTEWPWSSANDYLGQVGRDEAVRLWEEHPLLDYGKGWDDPEM